MIALYFIVLYSLFCYVILSIAKSKYKFYYKEAFKEGRKQGLQDAINKFEHAKLKLTKLREEKNGMYSITMWFNNE